MYDVLPKHAMFICGLNSHPVFKGLMPVGRPHLQTKFACSKQTVLNACQCSAALTAPFSRHSIKQNFDDDCDNSI